MLNELAQSRCAILIPAAHRATANLIGALLQSEQGGEHTFEGCRLSASGHEPATHYGADTAICTDTLPLLGDAARLYALCQTLSVQRERPCPSEMDTIACVAAADVCELSGVYDATEHWNSMGLKVVEVPV